LSNSKVSDRLAPSSRVGVPEGAESLISFYGRLTRQKKQRKGVIYKGELFIFNVAALAYVGPVRKLKTANLLYKILKEGRINEKKYIFRFALSGSER
jgi:hypothetical protein